MLSKSPNPGTWVSVGVTGGEVRDAWSSEVQTEWEGLSKEPPTRSSKFRAGLWSRSGGKTHPKANEPESALP